jgi:hypothetical protein
VTGRSYRVGSADGLSLRVSDWNSRTLSLQETDCQLGGTSTRSAGKKNLEFANRNTTCGVWEKTCSDRNAARKPPPASFWISVCGVRFVGDGESTTERLIRSADAIKVRIRRRHPGFVRAHSGDRIPAGERRSRSDFAVHLRDLPARHLRHLRPEVERCHSFCLHR